MIPAFSIEIKLPSISEPSDQREILNYSTLELRYEAFTFLPSAIRIHKLIVNDRVRCSIAQKFSSPRSLDKVLSKGLCEGVVVAFDTLQAACDFVTQAPNLLV